jgi:hypothetical protein
MKKVLQTRYYEEIVLGEEKTEEEPFSEQRVREGKN